MGADDRQARNASRPDPPVTDADGVTDEELRRRIDEELIAALRADMLVDLDDGEVIKSAQR
jgi:hypothetical protein